MKEKVASIILDAHIEKQLDYLIPKDFLGKIKPGMRVEVPLRGYTQKGYVFALKEKSSVKKLKSLLGVISDEIVDKKLFQLAIWMSSYYGTSLSKVMKFIVPTSIRSETKPKTETFISSAKTKKEMLTLCAELRRKSPAQAQILDVILRVKKKISLKELLFLSQVTRQPVEKLVEKKVLSKQKIIVDEAAILEDQVFFPTKPKKLTEEQKQCFDRIIKSIEEEKYCPHLIFGVTGSGKTEVYLQAIEKILNQNKSVIVLVPEISLTSQTIERFRSRFPKETIAVLHHRRSGGEKYSAWHNIKKGKARIIIGARSAVFCPAQRLGLIIVDEEHDTSYKQSEEAPSYHGKHIALMRGKIHSCPVILGSATPSIESYFLAEKNKYQLSFLKKRPAQASLPKVRVVNMQEEIKKKSSAIFSPALLDGIEKRYKNGEQTLLFLNRRGYHSYLLCTECSSSIKCPHCDVSLTFHKKASHLMCHSCGYIASPPKICPDCKKEGYIKYKGFGTELVENALKAIFPHIKTLRIDRDTTRFKHSHEQLYKSFRSGKADVLIGTQMIVKGLHFPSVTLVGVLNSDGALNIPDFRSSEYVFQLITQVAGRSGRCELPGEVIIQSFLPDNPTIKLAKKQDFESFYKMEIENRRTFNYPPFSRMVKFAFSSENEKLAFETAEKYRKKVIDILPGDFQIHPTVASGRSKLQDKFRFLFLVRGNRNISFCLERMKKEFSFPSSVHLFIDVDPVFTFI